MGCVSVLPIKQFCLAGQIICEKDVVSARQNCPRRLRLSWYPIKKYSTKTNKRLYAKERHSEKQGVSLLFCRLCIIIISEGIQNNINVEIIRIWLPPCGAQKENFIVIGGAACIYCSYHSRNLPPTRHQRHRY